MTTLAAIDRVVHHSVILDLMGLESYRAEASRRKIEVTSRQRTGGGVRGGNFNCRHRKK